MENEQNWHKVLEIIKNQISGANYKTWFSQSSINKISGEVLEISVPSTFIKTTLLVRYLPVIESAVERVYGKKFQIELKVDPSKLIKKIEVEEKEEDFNLPIASVGTSQNIGLNPKYTLKNFVVGLSNNLAFAAAQAVAQNPGVSYNPLFIYGGTGVGKTHLMQGIGNSLLEKNSNLKIIYCSSEGFTNDFIHSLQNKRVGEFKNKYRSCDLLMIDDIQFIAGRDSTQEEFFHTFNELHTKNSQIILTSDRPPHEMVELEARLKSRFQGGLMVDIQLPDFDTRVAILRTKCIERGANISEECLTLIASLTNTNARELEGKLIQIIQSAKLMGEGVTVESVRKMLGQPNTTNLKFDYKRVLSEVNSYFNIKMGDLTGPRRKKELVGPRHLAMYLLYEECKLPYERIGQVLGGRDHTTILHGVEKVRQMVNLDREVQKMLTEIKQSLQS